MTNAKNTQDATMPLTVKNISKAYKSKPVLKSVSLEVKPGEMFGLIGLNGIGKTTLIKTILGLVREDEGSIRLFAESHKKASSRRHIAYLPEKFQPSWYFRGHEYLRLSCAYYGTQYEPEIAEDFSKKLGLDPEALPHPIRRYSKGMGQKLGLIGAFMSEAPLLILDEPMSGLDPQARRQLKGVLREEKKKGKAIFFSSHILADIQEICDRLAIIDEGEVTFVGTPSKFMSTYAPKKNSHVEEAFLSAIGQL